MNMRLHKRNRMSTCLASSTAVAVAGMLFAVSVPLASAATRTVHVVPGEDLYAPQNLGTINGGDTVTWQNNGTHLIKSARIPARATPWSSPIQRGSARYSQTV